MEDRGPRGAQGGCGVQFAMGYGTRHWDGRLEVAAASGVDIGCPLHPGEAATGKAVEEEEDLLQPSTEGAPTAPQLHQTSVFVPTGHGCSMSPS